MRDGFIKNQFLVRGHSNFEVLRKPSGEIQKLAGIENVPSISEDFRDYCIQRNLLGAQSMDCVIPRKQYEQQRSKEAKIIQKINVELPYIKIFDPIDQFCDYSFCYLIRNEKSLFRDHNHISEYGSILIGEEINRRYFGSHQKNEN